MQVAGFSSLRDETFDSSLGAWQAKFDALCLVVQYRLCDVRSNRGRAFLPLLMDSEHRIGAIKRLNVAGEKMFVIARV